MQLTPKVSRETHRSVRVASRSQPERSRHPGAVTEQPIRTVREFVRAAGLSEERAERHRAAGALMLDGEPVTDLDTPVPDGSKVHVAGS
ncbi:hypothetical protein PSU4_46950 [Pseudonocardia sulfidoxydans NBRC 16205]|uniref:RNA-binding S4 domain-containing protein n=1 Tax=Pseudonocardia sulfidoxydans NBRC 16205 TaxID=1223511 RepID=A0A511DLQ8_9PSEU|nr:hypothetical protein PSU4_46950 [Pseudonocardia sulfidoxydans NBRC 16205]